MSSDYRLTRAQIDYDYGTGLSLVDKLKITLGAIYEYI